MKLFVSVKPGAKCDRVEKIDETHFRVTVKAPPSDGRANAAVIKAMARYLNLPPTRMEIVRGHQGKQKILSVQ